MPKFILGSFAYVSMTGPLPKLFSLNLDNKNLRGKPCHHIACHKNELNPCTDCHHLPQTCPCVTQKVQIEFAITIS